MTIHETFTSDTDLAFLLGPPRPDFNTGNTWFGSASIWSGVILNPGANENPVVVVAVTGITGVTHIQAEVFGTRTDDGTGLVSVNVTHIEWSLPGSATVLARLTFPNPVVFPISDSRYVGDWRFVDILANGPTKQQLFDDYFQFSDTLIGGVSNDTLQGSEGDDQITGGAGNDLLRGDAGNDTFLYRAGDAVANESVYGGSDTDIIRTIGSTLTGGVLQAGGVNLSAAWLTGIEELHVNGTEAVISLTAVGNGLTTFVGRSGFADQLTISGVSSGSLASLSFVNWGTDDIVAAIGTNGIDEISGTDGRDIFLGFAGVDYFDGLAGDDRFIIEENDLNPTDIITGGFGNDVLQVDGVEYVSNSTPLTDLRSLTLSGIEVLNVVKGGFILDGSDFVGAYIGTSSGATVSTVGLNRVIGNGGLHSASVQIELGTSLGIDLRSTVFKNWNNGLYQELVRIVAGAQTQLVYAPNEDTWINGSASTLGIYIEGGSADDQIYGSWYFDVIDGAAGHDYIHGLGGNDRISGEAGNDSIWGGSGDDLIAGLTGADNLFGEDGFDVLLGGTSADTLDGGANDDRLSGGAGADVLKGGTGYDLVSYSDSTVGLKVDLGNSATNTGIATGDKFTSIENLEGSNHNDTLAGNAGHNAIYGGNGNDVITGLEGNDNLTGGAGADTLEGGDGLDWAGYFNAAAAVRADLATAANNTGDAAGDSFVLIENLFGSNHNDRLSGTADSNVLNGSAGDDTLEGRGGDDMFIGGVGNDVFVTDGGDKITEGVGAGTDLVQSSITYKLGTNLENLTLTGTAAINGTGNTEANVLRGNAGANILNGGLGNDSLTGGQGADTFVFSTALGGGHIDRITDFSSVDDIIRLDNAVFAGLTLGQLTLGAFEDNQSGLATTAQHRIIYETDTGKLFFDADGTGATGRVQFALLTANLVLTNADFSVF